MNVLARNSADKPPANKSSDGFLVFVWSAAFIAIIAAVGWGVYFGIQHWPFGKKDPGLPYGLWNASQLPAAPTQYTQESVSSDLKSGPVTKISGLDVQWLNFQLPPRHLYSWSPDGRAIFAAQNGSIVRIDTSNWQITHRIDLSKPPMDINGLALSSEGLVAALRYAERSNVPVPIDLSTGKVVPLRTFRMLVVLNPADLQVVRQFIGPSSSLTGAPKSPVVCVSDDNTRVKLIDMRSGQVLHEAGFRINEPKSPDIAPLSGFEEMLLSPDGRTLYHRSHTLRVVNRTDISTGKFQALPPLEPSKEPVDFMNDNPTMYASSDGRLVAICVANSSREEERGYSIIDVTSQPVADNEEPLPTTFTTSFAFVGRNNRPVANSGKRHSATDFNVDDFDLVLPNRRQPDTRFQLDGKSDLKASRLSGSPVSDHVLVNTGGARTAWVKLPPATPQQAQGLKIEVPKAPIRGAVPQQPLQFVNKPVREGFDFGEVPTVELPADVCGACSLDGSRLYTADQSGRITAFDAQSLREVCRVELGGQRSPESEIGGMHATKAGPVVRIGQNKFMLLDGETLHAKHTVDLGESEFESSMPYSNLLCTRNRLNELELIDVQDGKLVARVTRRQLQRIETSKGLPENSTAVRNAAMGDHDATLVVRYNTWHTFSLKDGKLEHLSLMALPDGGSASPYSQAYPIPGQRLAIFVGDGQSLDAYEFPSLMKTDRMTKACERSWNQILSVTTNGLIYFTDLNSKLLTAVDADGKAILTLDRALGQLQYDRIVPMPKLPGRVFAPSGNKVYAVDLKPID